MVFYSRARRSADLHFFPVIQITFITVKDRPVFFSSSHPSFSIKISSKVFELQKLYRPQYSEEFKMIETK